MDGPPTDDVCPICHDNLIIPVKTGCGHWYCAGCILKHWSYGGRVEICKCPECECDICKLMVDASFLDVRDDEVVQVMERVTQYNRLYAQHLPHVRRRVTHYNRLYAQHLPHLRFLLIAAMVLVGLSMYTLMLNTILQCAISDPCTRKAVVLRFCNSMNALAAVVLIVYTMCLR